MRPLLIVGAAIVAIRYHKIRQAHHRRLMQYRAWGKPRNLSLISNQVGRDERVVHRAHFERLNRIIHGGDE